VIVFNESGLIPWEDNFATQLMATHPNLVKVTDETTEPETPVIDDKRAAMLARLEKARAVRKANRERTDSTA